jgi:hypothetical protein
MFIRSSSNNIVKELEGPIDNVGCDQAEEKEMCWTLHETSTGYPNTGN